jgi:hypothetical protein
MPLLLLLQFLTFLRRIDDPNPKPKILKIQKSSFYMLELATIEAFPV